MDNKLLYKITGGVAFFASLVVYVMTMQVSVSFWDCGEFIASAYYLQVPHPPGTPFFLLLGRLFAMLPFAENIGFKVNMISALTSAFTVFFLYSSAVKLIENYRGKDYKSTFDALATYISAAIGALSLGFGDTFWFNAVEAEVYASALFFASFCFWLVLLWNENSDKAGNEKYLLLIAYLVGISLGVHLFAVLTLVPIVMIVIFKNYTNDEKILAKSGYYFLAYCGLMLAIAIVLWSGLTDSTPPSPEEFRAVDKKFLVAFGIASALFLGIFWKTIFNRGSFFWSIIIGSVVMVTVYPGVIKYVPKLLLLVAGESLTVALIVFISLFAITGFIIYWSSKNGKNTVNLLSKAFLFVLIGYSSMLMIVIRSNQDTPINLNSPKTVSELISYINREQYGEQPMFKRRWTSEDHQLNIYKNYSSDLDFWWNYQMDHMFNRYLLWNYVGRENTVQDSGVDISKFFAIPFLIGMLGFYFHFRKDWKMASVLTVLLMFMGYLMAYYSNSQEPQPRERDYFYVGAFFVFSIWIAIGIRGILDLIKEFSTKIPEKPVTIALLVLFIGFIPVKMLAENKWQNDRSRNFVPWDYAYNMLQSVEKDAIIFTNGDNDTFPLWYLQDVEGVRRDVRIANLSLINTNWYIKQLKNTAPYGSQKVKMTFTDSQIDNIQPVEWKTSLVSLPVDENTIKRFGITDTAVTNKGQISWTMPYTMAYGEITGIRPQDIIVKNILEANRWERPVYFAVTCADNSMLGMNDYLVMEGMALRVSPVRNAVRGDYKINVPVMEKMLMHEPSGYSKDYSLGFKFRGLNDPTIFMDENHQRLTINYRHAYMRLASHYISEEMNIPKAQAVLKRMEEKMPSSLIPIPDYMKLFYSDLARNAQMTDLYKKLKKDIEETQLKSIQKNPYDFERQMNPYVILFRIYDSDKDYDKAIELCRKLKTLIPQDKGIDGMIENYQRLKAGGTTNEVLDNK